ncbi:MAG: hypothetical protein P8Y54_10225 [Xanthomonadales bacterium]
MLAAVLLGLRPGAAAPSDTASFGTARTNGFSELSRAFVTLAIQGDLSGASALFEHSVGAGDAGAALRTQFDDRFLKPYERSAAFRAASGPAHDVALLYRVYWRQNLLREVDAAVAEARLSRALEDLLRARAIEAPADSTPERLTARLLEDAGWHYSVSATPPWRDLFVWQTEEVRRYRVELTDVSVPVEVVFMDDFAAQGWKDFASLGLASTTGWVENDRLYCVAWAYDTQSENFEVSYLKHEARHLADLRRYPDMDTVELEYRAKLTELAFASQDLQRIWNDFRAKAADNPSSAHALANWRVVRDLEAALAVGGSPGAMAAWDPDRVNRAARRLLRENTIANSRNRAAASR